MMAMEYHWGTDQQGHILVLKKYNTESMKLIDTRPLPEGFTPSTYNLIFNDKYRVGGHFHDVLDYIFTAPPVELEIYILMSTLL